ncbi:hypothetical protein [Bdellovibrio sp.]|uniref:hypothetical protein n=1 Tax=Bdellovibrio sp. TaxID=28201 RepID=UPI0039E52FCE
MGVRRILYVTGCVFFLNVILFFTQNCGRVDLHDSSMTLPPSLVFQVPAYQSKTFSVIENVRNVTFEKMSFLPNSELLRTETDMGNSVEIAEGSIKFEPQPGFQGADHVIAYISIKEDSEPSVIDITFLVEESRLQTTPVIEVEVAARGSKVVQINDYIDNLTVESLLLPQVKGAVQTKTVNGNKITIQDGPAIFFKAEGDFQGVDHAKVIAYTSKEALPQEVELIFVVKEFKVNLPPNLTVYVDRPKDTTKTFEVKGLEGSLPISGLSFSASSSLLTKKTQKQNDVSISGKNVSFTVVNNFIGTDTIEVYAFGEAGIANKVQITFIVRNPSAILPDTSALVYDSSKLEDRTSMMSKVTKNAFQVPALADLSASGWKNLYFKPEEANSWTVVGDKIKSNVNSAELIGYHSPVAFSSYVHEAILASESNDDDSIYLIASAVIENDLKNKKLFYLHLLLVSRTVGGNNPRLGFGFAYHRYTFEGNPASGGVYNGSKKVILLAQADVGGYTPASNTKGHGWNTYGLSRVRVQREGKVFEAKASKWSNRPGGSVLTPLEDESLIRLDLNIGKIYVNNVEVALNSGFPVDIFKLDGAVGYAALSQADATFSGINFSPNLGLNADFLYDIYTNNVYERINPESSDISVKFDSAGVLIHSNYKLRTDVDVYTHLGVTGTKKIKNPDTGRTFQLNESTRSFSCVSGC